MVVFTCFLYGCCHIECRLNVIDSMIKILEINIIVEHKQNYSSMHNKLDKKINTVLNAVANAV